MVIVNFVHVLKANGIDVLPVSYFTEESPQTIVDQPNTFSSVEL